MNEFMSEIWANRLIAGDRMWEEVREDRKVAVKEVLRARVLNNTIKPEQYEGILGEPYIAE